MKTLYLVRHGETLLNKRHITQGWSDSPLTEKGIEQSKHAGEYFKERNLTFDTAYCSVSYRAEQTLENIVDPEKTRIIRKKELRECFMGDWESIRYEDVDSEEFKKGNFDVFKPHHGESRQDVLDRMIPCLKQICAESESDDVLVVSHGIACCFFYDYCKPYSDYKGEYLIGNCSIMKYIFDGETFNCQDIYQPNSIDL